MSAPPPPPLLTGQPNFRDLGGHTGAEGATAARGVIFRSGELHHLEGADRAVLEGLGIATIVDLRSEAEVAERGADVAPPGGQVVRIPITEADRLAELIQQRFDSGDYAAPEEDLMLGVYESLLTKWEPSYREFATLLVEAPLPLVVHCTHGKDRAGVAAAVALLALGVGIGDVHADFVESNVRRAAETEERLRVISEAAAERSGRADVDLEWMRRLFVVEQRFLDAALGAAVATHGSIEGFLRDGLALDDRRLARMRARVLSA